jgi:hypothetical protein
MYGAFSEGLERATETIAGKRFRSLVDNRFFLSGGIAVESS